jgi:gamma-glutamyl phosphate reductase
MVNVKKADDFFKKEIETAEVETSAHYTFRDGFRLGFGFFVGFLLGSVILTVLVMVLGSLLR